MKFDTKRRCRHCHNDYEIINSAQAYCRICCPSENRKSYQRLKLYKLSHPEFEKMFEHQNKCYAICIEPLRDKSATGLNVDHCHVSGKVRGLLCHRCNIIVGFLDKDDWKKSIDLVAA
jgi:hypothetical protein